MTATRLGVFTPGSPEWRAARSTGLGGSEVAAALGLSPWVSPFNLWHYKRGAIDGQPETPSMYWGKLLEHIVRGEYERRHPNVRTIDVGSMWVADGWRFAGPDARLDTQTGQGDEIELWEGKTADSYDSWNWAPHGSSEPDAIPRYYRIQTLWYMDVLTIHKLTLSVLIGGNDYREYTVPWDEDEAAMIRGQAALFRQSLIDGQQPDIDSSTSTYTAVRELHPDIDGGLEVEIPGEYVDGWADNKALAQQYAAEASRYRSLATMHMAGARYGLVAGTKRVRRQSRNGSTPFPVLIHSKEETSNA